MAEHFTRKSLSVFDRVPSGRRWGDVNSVDQDQFKSLRLQLKNLVERISEKENLKTPIKTFVSHPTPNGNSPRELWCCIYPKDISNKSFAFQIALIFSKRGAEICFCLGSGTHQSKNNSLIEQAQLRFNSAKERLKLAKGNYKFPDTEWKFKTRWLDENQMSDVPTFSGWVDIAAGNQGNSASISKFVSKSDPEFDEIDFEKEYFEAIERFGDLFDFIYSAPSSSKKLNSGVQWLKVPSWDRLKLTSVSLAKPLCILTGASGTGKTKLAESIAAYLSDDEKTNSAVVPVGADWTDNRPVLGFVNHLRTVKDGRPVFQSTPIVDLLLKASANLDIPHFLILDEMNLSHVERYFADFLSAMEQDDGVLRFHEEGADEDFRLPRFEGDEGVPQLIPYPKNLFVIGTVNIDETTYMFSPKVLDRANVIEFTVEKEEIEEFLSEPKPYPKTERAEDGVAEGFLKLAEDARSGSLAKLANGPKEAAAKHLTELFVILKAGRFEFAYRTANEVMRYLGVCSHLAEDKGAWNGTGWQSDLDDQILQKLLPKLHGSIGRIGGLLAELAHYCKDGKPREETAKLPTGTSALQQAAELVEAGAAFPKSLKKLKAMIQTLRDEQFVSFIQ